MKEKGAKNNKNKIEKERIINKEERLRIFHTTMRKKVRQLVLDD